MKKRVFRRRKKISEGNEVGKKAKAGGKFSLVCGV